jgi:hypothetical protein
MQWGRNMKKNILITIVVTFFISVILVILAIRPSLEIQKSWKQPDTIKYSGNDPNYLNVVSDSLDLGRFIPYLNIKRNYLIYVGKESGKVTHGHIKSYSFEYNQDLPGYLENCRVKWNDKGVKFIEPAGHEFFIPKDSFIKNR